MVIFCISGTFNYEIKGKKSIIIHNYSKYHTNEIKRKLITYNDFGDDGFQEIYKQQYSHISFKLIIYFFFFLTGTINR